MLIFRNYNNTSSFQKGSVLAIGNFDGIHEGHRYLLNIGKSIAKDNRKNFAVLSFEPHPIKFLKPKLWNKRLISFRTKIRLLKYLGVNTLYSVRFEEHLSKMSANEFIKIILVNGLNISHVIVGEDFRFGNNRKGDIGLLNKYSENNFFSLKVIKKKNIDGNICSSSRIRKMVSLGQIEKANKSLGYFWEVEGRVMHGDARGRELGFPTANIHYRDQVTPLKGVYSALIKIEGEKKWRMAAISSGVRPQFGTEGKEILEVNIFNFSKNIYKKQVRVAFVNKIREEKTFINVDSLVLQMQSDCEKIKIELSKLSNNLNNIF